MYKLTHDQIRNLVNQVVETRTEEMDCDEMLSVLTEYATKLATGECVKAHDELVKHHLENCVECQEEFEMIKAVAEDGSLGSE